MTREEIMQGLRHCYSAAVKWCQASVKGECNYGGQGHCRMELMKDALALLEAEAPRVLTLEEAQALKTPGTLVWLETSGGYEGCRYKAVPAIISDNTHGILPDGAMHFYSTTDRAWSAYNREICGWRLWTNEPSDQQRLEAKWAG